MTRNPLPSVHPIPPYPNNFVPILAKPTNPPAPQGHLFLLGLQWVPSYQPFFIGEILATKRNYNFKKFENEVILEVFNRPEVRI
jgi:hypothetical protein